MSVDVKQSIHFDTLFSPSVTTATYADRVTDFDFLTKSDKASLSLTDTKTIALLDSFSVQQLCKYSYSNNLYNIIYIYK